MKSYFEEKIKVTAHKKEINGRGNRNADHSTPLYPQKLALKFADQRRSLSG
jgi:hypothetical protein